MTWGRYRCHCGRFVRDLVATIRSYAHGEGISRVDGTCARHGRVDVTATSEVWWEDFDDRAGVP